MDFRSKRAAESILREIWLDIEEVEMPTRRYVQDVSTDIFNDDAGSGSLRSVRERAADEASP